MLLETHTSIDAPPEAVFAFFEDVATHYEDWHPDHITFRWIDEAALAEGNRAYFEEVIAGERKTQTVEYVHVEENRYLEFRPTSRLIRLLLPHMSFRIEPEDGGCRLIQRIRVRTGPIGRRVKRREFDAVRQHMREEGTNLKRIVEGGDWAATRTPTE